MGDTLPFVHLIRVRNQFFQLIEWSLVFDLDHPASSSSLIGIWFRKGIGYFSIYNWLQSLSKPLRQRSAILVIVESGDVYQERGENYTIKNLQGTYIASGARSGFSIL